MKTKLKKVNTHQIRKKNNTHSAKIMPCKSDAVQK